jgi:hypothetical protein
MEIDRRSEQGRKNFFEITTSELRSKVFDLVRQTGRTDIKSGVFAARVVRGLIFSLGKESDLFIRGSESTGPDRLTPLGVELILSWKSPDEAFKAGYKLQLIGDISFPFLRTALQIINNLQNAEFSQDKDVLRTNFE